MAVFEGTLAVLDRTLSLGGRGRSFERSTRLLGYLPELDSLAVVNVITELERQFGVQIEDDEVSADTFETVGSLVKLIEQKLSVDAT